MKMIKCVCTFAVLVMGCMSVPLSSVRVQGPFHRPEIRAHVGIPSIAVSPVNGRMWATWYNGEHRGEDYLNYVTLATSADGGKHWNEVLVADPDEDGPKRSFDPELWIAPDGKLRWTWTERTCDPAKGNPAKDYGLDPGDPKTDVVKMATLSAEDAPTLLVKHGPIDKDVGRKELTAYLSKDEGKSWIGGLVLDERAGVSYPDGQQTPDGSIVVIYDRSRLRDREILFAKFTEDDVLAGKDVSGRMSLRNIVTSGNVLR